MEINQIELELQINSSEIEEFLINAIDQVAKEIFRSNSSIWMTVDAPLQTTEAGASNQTWLDESIEANRNVIPTEKIEAWLDPNVPIEELFTKVKALGSGAFGSTGLWKMATGEEFAIKEIIPRRHWGGGENDFEIGLALDHPNIVQVNNLVEKVDSYGQIRHYLVMEYVDGKTLWEHGSLSEEERRRIGQEAVDAISHMLGRAILPSDLHGGNLMITKSGDWKFLDLGLYRRAEEVDGFDGKLQEIAGMLERIRPDVRWIGDGFRQMPECDLAMLGQYCGHVQLWMETAA